MLWLTLEELLRVPPHVCLSCPLLIPNSIKQDCDLRGDEAVTASCHWDIKCILWQHWSRAFTKGFNVLTASSHESTWYFLKFCSVKNTEEENTHEATAEIELFFSALQKNLIVSVVNHKPWKEFEASQVEPEKQRCFSPRSWRMVYLFLLSETTWSGSRTKHSTRIRRANVKVRWQK